MSEESIANTDHNLPWKAERIFCEVWLGLLCLVGLVALVLIPCFGIEALGDFLFDDHSRATTVVGIICIALAIGLGVVWGGKMKGGHGSPRITLAASIVGCIAGILINLITYKVFILPYYNTGLEHLGSFLLWIFIITPLCVIVGSFVGAIIAYEKTHKAAMQRLNHEKYENI